MFRMTTTELVDCGYGFFAKNGELYMMPSEIKGDEPIYKHIVKDIWYQVA